jgi:predicted metal-dependent hydrolase
MIQTYKDITYNLARSDRKTMSIYVELDGRVSVRAPKDLEISKINKIIDLKSYWIYTSLSEVEQLNGSKVKRQMVDGEGFLYLGKSYRLKIDKQLATPLALAQGYFILDEDHISRAKSHFINFYKEEAKKLIPKRVDYYKKKLGVNPNKIRVMELKNRWASRGKSGLNFHWKMMLAPISIIDYVIVHELAHYLKEDHSDEFWEIVESVMPNYKDKKEWLKINGAGLDV